MAVGPETARGQTTIDFAIAIGLFLVVVAFVVAFVPTIFAPFQSADGPQAADRVATSLSTDRLGDPAEPYVLNETCTSAFFEQLDGDADDGGAPTTCRYDTTVDNTSAMFALPDPGGVNVSVHRLDGPVAAPFGEALAAGPAVPDSGTVTAARRVVLLDGETYRLLVRVW
ncbi:DUF7287 family protein [Halobellus rubicundus]|uniref:Type IV pilin n=1 Tax=Halobellus rubicundus TaxID=2996466 RepID=A0ABD5M8F8_9EURY